MADQDYLTDHFDRIQSRFEIGTCSCNAPVYAGIKTLPKELYIHCDQVGKHLWKHVGLAAPISALGQSKKTATTKTLLTARITSLLDFLDQYTTGKQSAELLVVDKPAASDPTTEGHQIGVDVEGEDRPGSSRRESARLAKKHANHDGQETAATSSEQALVLASTTHSGGQEQALALFDPHRAAPYTHPDRTVIYGDSSQPATREQLQLYDHFQRTMVLSDQDTDPGTVDIYVSRNKVHSSFNILQISSRLLMVFGPLVALQLFSSWRQRNGNRMWDSLLTVIPGYLPEWLRVSVDPQAINHLTRQLNLERTNRMLLDIEAAHGYRMRRVLELPAVESSAHRAQRALADVISASKTC